jgi:hypothetical protein
VHTFCGVSRDFFFFDFKNMSGKRTSTNSEEKSVLSRNFQNPQTVSISRNQVSKWRRWTRGTRGRRGRRRRTSRLDDPLVLIMTPFFIILERLTDPCESFLDHPVQCRLLPETCLGRKPRLDLTLTQDETETEIGVLILVLEFFLHPHVNVPLPNFWTPVVVEQCHQKIPVGLFEGPTFDPIRPFTHPPFLDNRHISRCWKECDSRGEEHLLVLLTLEQIPLSNDLKNFTDLLFIIVSIEIFFPFLSSFFILL